MTDIEPAPPRPQDDPPPRFPLADRAPYGTDRWPFTDLPDLDRAGLVPAGPAALPPAVPRPGAGGSAGVPEQRAVLPVVPAARHRRRAVPIRVMQTWPQVDPATWVWVSPLRLRGRHRITPSRMVLVVVDGPHAERALGNVISDGQDERPVYAELMVALAASYGRESACVDGVPLLGHDEMCTWCGRPAAVHRTPDLPGPAGEPAHPVREPATGWFE